MEGRDFVAQRRANVQRASRRLDLESLDRGPRDHHGDGDRERRRPGADDQRRHDLVPTLREPLQIAVLHRDRLPRPRHAQRRVHFRPRGIERPDREGDALAHRHRNPLAARHEPGHPRRLGLRGDARGRSQGGEEGQEEHGAGERRGFEAASCASDHVGTPGRCVWTARPHAARWDMRPAHGRSVREVVRGLGGGPTGGGSISWGEVGQLVGRSSAAGSATRAI